MLILLITKYHLALFLLDNDEYEQSKILLINGHLNKCILIVDLYQGNVTTLLLELYLLQDIYKKYIEARFLDITLF